jgi:hypothetical protein
LTRERSEEKDPGRIRKEENVYRSSELPKIRSVKERRNLKPFVLLFDLFHVLPDIPFIIGVSEEESGMVSGHERNPPVLVKPSPKKRDLFFGLEKGLGRKGPQGTDQFGPDDFKLFNEKRLTGADFIRFRVSVPRRTALDDVGNVDLLPAELDGLDDFGEKLSGQPDERLSL